MVLTVTLTWRRPLQDSVGRFSDHPAKAERSTESQERPECPQKDQDQRRDKQGRAPSLLRGSFGTKRSGPSSQQQEHLKKTEGSKELCQDPAPGTNPPLSPRLPEPEPCGRTPSATAADQQDCTISTRRHALPRTASKWVDPS